MRFRSGWAALLALPLLAQDDHFEKKVRPILSASCQVCHNDKVKNGNIDFKTLDGYQVASRSGIYGDPAKPEKSPMLEALLYESKIKMPPAKKLPAEQIEDIRVWLAKGAPWPGAGLGTRTKGIGVTDNDRKFWAFRPLKNPAQPVVKNTEWARSPIDALVLKKLEEKGLAPAAPADKVTWLRRATFDLTGLPPTPEEIAAFQADSTPQAWARVVDRLLESPRYGEKWGRHWLDVVRYADSTGSDEDHRYPHAWRYRDYVIRAFNQDMPYDRFLREQIAGDILAQDPASGTGPEGIVATGFLALGKKALAQKDLVLKVYDVVDDQIDATGKAILGLTVSCARCHDHKFDPILQKDYYGLASIFASTESYEGGANGNPVETPLVPIAEYKEFTSKWDAILALDDKANKILDLDKDAREHRNKIHTRMEAYMLAAYDVYAGGRPAASAIGESGLDAAMLDRWVEYLRDKTRPELARWHAATAATRPEVARQYAADFKAGMYQYDQDLGWWNGARKRYPKSGKVVGPKPEINKEQHPFFFKVWRDGGPLYRTVDEQIAKLEPAKQEELRKILAERTVLEKDAPTREIPMACAVKEGKPVDQHLFLRGNHNAHGDIVPKGYLRVISGDQPPVSLVSKSGRLDLANWLVSRENPLTPRVMVNRIWQGHFGEGLVRTPDNFGKLGEAPTHPELVDYLASSFVEKGWSIKSLHREIMLSNTYRMSAMISDAAREKDPENRLLAAFPKRRLTIEEIRDSLLVMSGKLDPAMGGTLDPGIGTDGETSADRISMNPDKTNRRSVYLPLRRANLPNLFSLFDFVDSTNPTGKRGNSMVPTQSLFFMNSPFVQGQAAELSKRVRAARTNDRERAELAYMTVLSRPPAPAELDLALSHVSRSADAWDSLCRVLMASNEFMFVF